MVELKRPGRVPVATMASGLMSKSTDGGQRVIMLLPSTAISPGDYILELKSDDGHVSETYLFRAKPSRHQDANK